jgi:hypothetical protein
MRGAVPSGARDWAPLGGVVPVGTASGNRGAWVAGVASVCKGFGAVPVGTATGNRFPIWATGVGAVPPVPGSMTRDRHRSAPLKKADEKKKPVAA